MWKELLIHSPCSHEYSNYSSSKTRSKFDDIQYGSAGKSGASGAFRSSPAERSLRSSSCLQTLITSANGGPFLNRDDANIYIYIYRCVPTPYSWTTPPSSRSTPTSTIPRPLLLVPSGLPSNGDCPGRFTSHRCSARWKPHGNVFKRMSRRREK